MFVCYTITVSVIDLIGAVGTVVFRSITPTPVGRLAPIVSIVDLAVNFGIIASFVCSATIAGGCQCIEGENAEQQGDEKHGCRHTKACFGW